ncbi:MAG: LysR substrate-binding domain-containing protein, partial [Betaproteobacteria bacterium]
RYALPKVVSQFKQRFPKVHLALQQGSPQEIVELLLEGRADIGIATEALEDIPELVTFPYYSWHHTVVVPKGHPLESKKNITIEEIAEHPIVTYHEGFTGRKSVDQTFAKAGITPDIVMSALDADVIKTYVELGLGIGIIASMAYQSDRDTKLSLLDVGDLFENNTTRIALRKGYFLRGYAYEFIELCSPKLDEPKVKAALKPESHLDLD